MAKITRKTHFEEVFQKLKSAFDNAKINLSFANEKNYAVVDISR